MKTSGDRIEEIKVSKVTLRDIIITAAALLSLLFINLIFFFDFRIKFIDNMLDYSMSEFPAVTSLAIGVLAFVRMGSRIENYKRSGHTYHIGWAILLGLLGIYLMYVSYSFIK